MGNRYDLHCHSTYSDGLFSIPELMRFARQMGMAALVVTDHHYSGNVRWMMQECLTLTTPEFPVIPGAELRVMQHEFLIFGAQALEIVMEYGKREPPDVVTVLQRLTEAGAGIVACHPFDEFFADAVRLLPYIYGIEVLAGGYEYRFSGVACAFAKKNGLFTVESTDDHHGNVGARFTETDTKLRTTDDISEWIRP